MGFDVSSVAANAVLYSVLIFFTLLAIVAGGFLNSYLPSNIISCCLLRSSSNANSNDTNNSKSDVDHFLSARNSASALEIALSFFASGMGAWVSVYYFLESTALHCHLLCFLLSFQM